MQIRQIIFKCFIMQICRLFFTAFWNFWRITRLSTTNHRWVINAQTGPVFFGPPCIAVVTVSRKNEKTNFVHAVSMAWMQLLCQFLTRRSGLWLSSLLYSMAVKPHLILALGYQILTFKVYVLSSLAVWSFVFGLVFIDVISIESMKEVFAFVSVDLFFLSASFVRKF